MNSPITVCFVGKQMLSPSIEGHHVASKRIIEASIRAGIDTKVVTIEPHTKNLKNFRNWVVVNSKISPRVHAWFLPSALSATDDLLTSISIASRIKLSKYDLVHVLNINKEAYLFAHNLLRIKKPLLMHLYHSQYVLTDDVFLIRNIALRAGLYGRIFDNHVLTVNFAMSKFFVKKLGVNPERVHYAPYPIDTSTFKPSRNKDKIREKYGLSSVCPIVAYVGSLNPVRGIFNLMKSFRYVLTRFPQALLYVSYPQSKGEGAYARHVRGLVRGFKLQSNVAIRRPSLHVQDIFNLADIVVLPFVRPYWVDPPLVLLEAMSTGAAVITTSVGSISDIIRNRENAVLTNAENTLVLANDIIGLLENPRESRKIGESARKTIIQNYSYENVGKRLSKIYDLILDHQN